MIGGSYNSPMVGGWYNSPMVDGWYILPMVGGSYNSPMVGVWYNSPMVGGWYIIPMVGGSYNSPMVGSWYNSPMAGGSRRAGRALRRRSQRQLFCNILSINALITVVAVAITPNIKMSVWFLCSCEAAINNARIVAATIIYCSRANRFI